MYVTFYPHAICSKICYNFGTKSSEKDYSSQFFHIPIFISIFGKFIVIVLKTDKSKNNKGRKLFLSIHKTIKKMILTAGGTQTGFLEFKPHCSIASISQITDPVFQKIQNKSFKDLTKTVSEVHLSVNPRVLQYRINTQRQVD